jgi:hypothetical protein
MCVLLQIYSFYTEHYIKSLPGENFFFSKHNHDQFLVSKALPATFKKLMLVGLMIECLNVVLPGPYRGVTVVFVRVITGDLKKRKK